ncbi:MAG: hypothetical protein U0414_22430 [Polyangiaceae bacterium]
MTELYSTLVAVDEQLASAGVPRLSDAWRRELRRFYEHPTARTHVGRIGRGGAKSTAAAKCLTVEVVFGDWVVPPGERHWAISISENLDEARARLGQIATYLRILGVRFEQSGDQILLPDRPLGFWTRAARIGALSGPRVVAWAVDEAAKLSVDGVNPSEELVTSMLSMSITHPGARGRIYSSPMSTLDYHYRRVEEGDTDSQVVSIGPTWEYNPSISYEQTLRLYPRKRDHDREARALVSAPENGAFDADAIDGCFAAREQLTPGTGIVVIDPSSLAADAFTWGLFRVCTQDRSGMYVRNAKGDPIYWRSGQPIEMPGTTRRPLPPYYELAEIHAIEGGVWSVRADDVVDQIARFAKRCGAHKVVSDQRESFALESMFRDAGLQFVALPWTTPSKTLAVERVRHWTANRELALCADDALRRELHAFAECFTASGAITYRARQSGHDDRVALLLTAALAEMSGHLPNTPNRNHGPSMGQTPLPF